MSSPGDETKRDVGGKESPAGVSAQLDALQARWDGLRHNIAELSHAGAEAWRAVEPDARRLMSEMRGLLDSASDRFREARAGTPDHADTDAGPATLPPPATPHTTSEASSEPPPRT